MNTDSLQYKDYQITPQQYGALPGDTQVEIIDDVIYMMVSPTQKHQIIAGSLYAELRQHIRSQGGSCRPFIAPFNVRIKNNLSRNGFDTLQPDVFLVRDPLRLKEDYCEGAPDFVAEILSPSSAYRDQIIKLDKYHMAGVREYWMIDPVTETIVVWQASDPQHLTRHTFAERIPLEVLPGMEIRMDEIL